MFGPRASRFLEDDCHGLGFRVVGSNSQDGPPSFSLLGHESAFRQSHSLMHHAREITAQTLLSNLPKLQELLTAPHRLHLDAVLRQAARAAKLTCPSGST